jgi:hypothetical protein
MFELKYKLIGDDAIRPICPHCEQKIEGEILYFEQAPLRSATDLGIEKIRLFVCPHCKKVLGISM